MGRYVEPWSTINFIGLLYFYNPFLSFAYKNDK